MKLYTPPSSRVRTKARENQQTGQHYRVGIERLSQEQEKALQRDLDHDEAQPECCEIGEPAPPSFGSEAPALDDLAEVDLNRSLTNDLLFRDDY